jgi:hypothetical protein
MMSISLAKISQTDDAAMIDLGSQTQTLQEVVNLLMPNVAPATPKEEVIGVEGKPPAKENIFLVYPVVGVQAIEEAAKGLFQFEEKRHSNPMMLKLQKEAAHPRNTAIVISKDDHKCLHPKGWLNDVLIDFRLQWITRMEFQPDSSIHVFTTHFYTKLEDEGVNAVLSWTANRRINVFTKKFFMF